MSVNPINTSTSSTPPVSELEDSNSCAFAADALFRLSETQPAPNTLSLKDRVVVQIPVNESQAGETNFGIAETETSSVASIDLNKKKYKDDYNTEYYVHNRDFILEQQKGYRTENKKKIAKTRAAYCEAHREEMQTYQQNYRKENRDEINARRRAGRAAKREREASGQSDVNN